MKLTTNQQDIILEGKIYGNSVNNIGGYQKYSSLVNIATFKEARDRVVKSNDAFSLRVSEHEGNIQGKIDNSSIPSIMEWDFSSEPNAKRVALDTINQLFKEAFSFADCVLFQDAIIKISSNEYWYYAKAHHVIMDGWGFTLMMEKILSSYQQQVIDDSQTSAPSFIHYIKDHQEYTQSKKYHADFSYWMESFNQVPELPFTGKYELDQKSSEVFSSDRVTISLAYDEFEQIGDAASQYGVSFVTFIYTALYIYFSRIYNSESLVIGSPVHNRRNKLEKSIIGSFVNVNALNIAAGQIDNVASLMTEIAQLQRKSQRHSRFPMGELIRHLKQASKLNQPRLFDIHFNYQKLDFKLTLEDEYVETHFLSHDKEQVPLSFVLCDYGPEQEIKLHLDFNLNYFWKDQVEEILTRFVSIVRQMVSQDCKNVPLSKINLVSDYQFDYSNNNQLNSTFDIEKEKSFVDLFESQVTQTPDAIATSCAMSHLTYKELSVKTNQLANCLLAKGLKIEQFVGIFLNRSVDMLVAVIAVLKAGGTYVPIDPNYPEHRVNYIFKDTDCRFVLTEKDFAEKLPQSIKQPIFLDEQESINVYAEQLDERCYRQFNKRNLAYVIYTSGSSGNPKGVMIEHQNMMAFIAWAKQQFNQVELNRVFASTSICFDLSVFEMFVPLCVGGEVVVAENILALREYTGKTISLINTVPSAIQSLITLNAIPSGLQCVNLAGELLKQSIVDELYDLGVAKVFDLYGPSEDTTYSTFTLRTVGGRCSIGRAITGTQSYISNPQTHTLLPKGVQGELLIGGLGVTRGYLNQEKLTKEKFIDNPWGEGRVYKTGDLVKVNQQGELEYLGRMDSQCKVRGYRVEPGEIETQITALDFIQDCSVIMMSDSDGVDRLKAFLVRKISSPSSHDNVQLKQIRCHLSELLPAYMVPEEMEWIDTIPLTPNGKVDKLALSLMKQAFTAIPQDRLTQDNRPQEPTNDIETKVRNIWREVLQNQSIGLRSDFFSLGGNSLQLMKVIAKLENIFGVSVDIKAMYSNNCIEKQSLYIEQQIKLAELIDDVTKEKDTGDANCLII